VRLLVVLVAALIPALATATGVAAKARAGAQRSK
jgi:hypothetical protein